VKGTGYLDQKLPAPPTGVFDFVRSYGIEKVTWQPQHGVRLATVVRRVDVRGKPSGFVLAGRSLRLVEEQKSILWRMALGIWIIVMALVFGGASLLHRTHRVKPTSA
jgi:predicted deacylase